jgi:hypothetical protein
MAGFSEEQSNALLKPKAYCALRSSNPQCRRDPRWRPARPNNELIAVAIKAAEGTITISGLIGSAAVSAPAD